jgi:hypothetical protein
VRRILIIFASSAAIVAGLALYAFAGEGPADKKEGSLILRGDMAYFLGPGKPKNCTLNNVFKRGDPVGWRIEAVDPQTATHADPDTQLVVHLNYNGKIQDIPMRWRANATNPTYQFWVAKWIVPADAPTGIVRFTVTAKDKNGRTGEYKPFDVEASQLTIVDDTPSSK